MTLTTRPIRWHRALRAGVLAAIVVAGAALAAALGGDAGSATRTAAAQTRPNILVLETDDQTVENMGALANVRRLIGAQGVTFANSFVSNSLCCPSRSTLLTGQYSHNNGVWTNSPPNGGYERLDKANTLAVWLQRSGYHTAHLGKFLNGYGARGNSPTEIPPGWSEWHAGVDPSTYQYWSYTLNENGKLVRFGNSAAEYQTDVYGDKASEIIRRTAPSDQPFFLWVAFLAPHSGGPRGPDDPANQATPEPAPRHRNAFASQPLPAPPSLNEADVSDKPAAVRNRALLPPRRLAAIRENYQQRLESLLAVDEAIAKILTALGQTGELDNTLVIFTSDNGFMHGEHRIPAGKVVVYEPSVRVPLLMRGPGIPRGRTSSALVANVDLAPTMLDAANASATKVVDGRSLLPLAKDTSLESGRDILLETPGYAAVRTHRYKYVEYTNGDRELYDLQIDPYELTSRHADPAYAAVRAELAGRLAQLRSCAGARCRQGPSLSLNLSFSARRSSPVCARSAVRAAISGADARWITQVEFFVSGKRVARDAKAPFRITLARARLARGRSLLFLARVSTSDGRRATLSRVVRTCR